jgi:hypothetical protein
MNITKEEAHTIALEVVRECRSDVDEEIRKLHEADRNNAWTEAKAKTIAEQAAQLAVKQITNDFYAGVGKKTVTMIGASVVATVILTRDYLKSMIGMK